MVSNHPPVNVHGALMVERIKTKDAQRKHEMYDIKEMVKDNKKVKFLHFKNNEFWYVTETGFEFPVQLDDIGTAVMLAEDKALLFMRYIRKHVKLIEEAKMKQLI